MSRTSLFLCSGLALFLGGGAVLAFGGDPIGAPLGTTMALAGVGLLIWGWLSRPTREDGEGGS